MSRLTQGLRSGLRGGWRQPVAAMSGHSPASPLSLCSKLGSSGTNLHAHHPDSLTLQRPARPCPGNHVTICGKTHISTIQPIAMNTMGQAARMISPIVVPGGATDLKTKFV